MDLHLCQLGCCDSPNACDLCHGSGVRTTPFSNKLRIVQLHVLDPALDPALCLTLSKDLDLSLCHWVDAREILLAEGDRIKRVTLPGHTQPTGHLIKVGPGDGGGLPTHKVCWHVTIVACILMRCRSKSSPLKNLNCFYLLKEVLCAVLLPFAPGDNDWL